MCCYMFRQSEVEEEIAFFPVTKQNFGKEVKTQERRAWFREEQVVFPGIKIERGQGIDSVI